MPMPIFQVYECKFGSEFLGLIVDWIGENLNPDDVFGEDALKDWAESHGYQEDED